MRLIYLYQPETERKLRLEVPTVFGRSDSFYHYRDEVRFSPEEAEALQRLDYIEIVGDKKISRTHGVLDPAELTIRDLNSLNGIYLNGRLVPCTPEHAGPPQPLQADDELRVGDMRFVVQTEEAGLRTIHEKLRLNRYAVVAPVGAPDTGLLGEFLAQRKLFRVRDASDWETIRAALEALQFLPGEPAITVVGLVGEPVGDVLRCAGAELRARQLLDVLDRLPGSKLVALQATADPAGFEAAFRDHAHQDSILVTSTVSTTAGLEEALEPDLGTVPLEARRKSLSGVDAAAYHSVLDGLDGLIPADSNVLNVAWLVGYTGALRVIVGTRLRSSYEVEMSYQTDEPSSFRVRHQFESTPVTRSRGGRGSGLDGSDP